MHKFKFCISAVEKMVPILASDERNYSHLKWSNIFCSLLQGSGLNLAATKDDIDVFIANKRCNVTNLSDTQIFCIPPGTQPQGRDEHGNEDSSYPVVMVTWIFHSK